MTRLNRNKFISIENFACEREELVIYAFINFSSAHKLKGYRVRNCRLVQPKIIEDSKIFGSTSPRETEGVIHLSKPVSVSNLKPVSVSVCT